MRSSVSGEIPRNPVGVLLELLGWSQRQVMKDIHNNMMVLTNRLRMTLSKKMAGLVVERLKENRKLEMEMKKHLRADAGKSVVDKVYTTLERSEAYAHGNQLKDKLRRGDR